MTTTRNITTTNPTTIPSTDVPVVGGTAVEYVSQVSFQLQVNDYNIYKILK